MRIELTIKTDYLPNWKTWEGVRELIQNGRDAEVEHKAPLTVTYKDGTLTIENEGVELPHEALLMGHTTKASRGDLIGQFGEGLKLGILALVRAGHAVTVYSGDDVWEPKIETSERFKAQVLCFYISHHRKSKPRVRIEVEGVDADAWKDMRQLFLFLNARKGDDTIETDGGALLLAPRMKGKIFVKGIFVSNEPEFQYGYDLKEAELDRDRRMVNRADLARQTAVVWHRALIYHSTREDLNEGFIKLLGMGGGTASPEALHWRWASAQLPTHAKEYVVERFTRRHGAAVPVATFADSKDLAHLGKKGVVVNEVLYAVLSETMQTADEVKAQLRTEVVKHWSYDDLDDHEMECYTTAYELLNKVRPDTPDVGVVDFRAKDLEGLYQGGKLYVAKKMLTSVEDALAVMIHEASHAYGGDGDKDHVVEIENTWRDVVKLLRKTK